ncbi:MAG: class I SAM-dependent rRNA methyltransferase [Candidatus Eisenbacteria bacterium]|nr:class I SAM-dependent rRNA methyltransferase [Candidatus Eisenbacteria bacterium]
MPRVILKKNEERRLKTGHLWVFSNEISSIDSDAKDGEPVDVVTGRGNFVGRGFLNRHSLISVRLLSRKAEQIDRKFFRSRILRSLDHRKNMFPGSNVYRCVYSEGDFLPGLVVDRYGDYLAVQFLTKGMDNLREEITGILIELLSPKGIVMRNDTPSRELEGLELWKGVGYGEVPDRVEVDDDGTRILVDMLEGQKTGFYLDQRENRTLLQDRVTGKSVLDCFSYTGAWSLKALSYGAQRITLVESSNSAMALAQENMDRNGAGERVEYCRGDAFDELRRFEREGRSFDCIVLDPPSFIKNKNLIREGLSGYREINLRAMRILAPSGIIVTSSCSHHLSREDFVRTLVLSARDSGRSFRIARMGSQSRDHPVLLSMKETEYLKCILLEDAV